MANLIEKLLGCRHRKCSFPITLKIKERKPDAAYLTRTYVVCLECGKEFPYDWSRMRALSLSEERKMARAARRIA
jgi:hypothetical protein